MTHVLIFGGRASVFGKALWLICPGSLKRFQGFIEPIWTLLVSETPAQYYGRFILARQEHIFGTLVII